MMLSGVFTVNGSALQMWIVTAIQNVRTVALVSSTFGAGRGIMNGGRSISCIPRNSCEQWERQTFHPEPLS